MRYLLLLIFLICTVARSEPDGPRWYYIGPYDSKVELGETIAIPPPNTVGAVDLRGTSGGVGFFSTDAPIDASPEYLLLGTALSDEIESASMTIWEASTNVEVPGTSYTILEILWGSMTEWADPTGQDHARPILPNSKGEIVLQLGGHSVVAKRKFQGEFDPAWPVLRDSVAEDYRRVRSVAIKPGSRDRTVHLRFLSTLSKKFGIQDETKFIPRDLPKEKKRKPETTYTDAFTRSNADALGGSWNEVYNDIDIVSNAASAQSNTDTDYARYDQDLSSDDHYCQAVCAWAGTRAFGPVVRCNVPGTDTYANASFYWFRWSGSEYQIYRRVSGSVTLIATGRTSPTPSSPDTLYIEADGSNLLCRVNGNNVYGITDTSLSGLTRCGIAAYDAQANVTFDDWEATDIEAAVSGGGTGVVNFNPLGGGPIR